MLKTNRALAVFIVLIVIFSTVSVQTATVKAQSKRIVVPNDYPTIQEAVGNASAGDTVFVKKGTYNVNSIGIAKSISLIGEDPKQTIINGQRSQNKRYPVPYNLPAISIYSSYVTVSGFSITNCFYGISVEQMRDSGVGVRITNNIISNNNLGINTEETIENSEVSENIIANNTRGINGYFVNSVISKNIISGNGWAITAQGEWASNLTINGNEIISNAYGISLQVTSNVYIYSNRITGNKGLDTSLTVQLGDWNDQAGYGIKFSCCNNSAIYDNIIEQNDVGVYLPNYLLYYRQGARLIVHNGSGNQVYNNNFFNNNINATIEHQYPYSEAYRELIIEYQNLNKPINGTDFVSWDNDTIGNYWSDYNAQGSYVVDEKNIDYYPLSQPARISFIAPPTPASTDYVNETQFLPIVVVTILAVFVVSLFLYTRHYLKRKCLKAYN